MKGRRTYHPAMRARTVLERGPKGNKAVAFAVDWPGWNATPCSANCDTVFAKVRLRCARPRRPILREVATCSNIATGGVARGNPGLK